MALHALSYCERLFYLEEVEELRVADHSVYEGRTLHDTELDRSWQRLELASESWGIHGKADFARYREGKLVAVEHKKGRSKGDAAWDTDILQVTAYAVLLEEHFGRPVPEGRIRYHATNKTVRVTVDDAARNRLRAAVTRARELSRTLQRPPVTDNENLCAKCSLAPVCLPEESRLAAALSAVEEAAADLPAPRRLFPKNDARRALHVVDRDAVVKRSGLQFVVRTVTGESRKYPGMDVGAIILHGSAQITSQAVHFAAANDIAVHWVSGGGSYVGGVAPPAGVQRRLRQYQALQDRELRMRLSRRVVHAKIENQMRFIARQSRTRHVGADVKTSLKTIRIQAGQVPQCAGADALRGSEGMAARAYFSALGLLVNPKQEHMRFNGRSRRPPRDGFNAALSFGYGLLYREVMAAIIAVGLDSTVGFFHTPRTAAHPLALDLMELFRTTLWDMPLVASINRRQWTEQHVVASRNQVWLSDDGKRLAVNLFEQRKQESWKHPALSYSLSYARAIELEARLLEKEWSGEEGVFARMRLRG